MANRPFSVPSLYVPCTPCTDGTWVYGSKQEHECRPACATGYRSGCTLTHASGSDSYGGENLASNGCSRSESPDQVLQRWAENEENKHGQSFSAWGHFTQVIWRGTKYVGCGQASRRGCHIQVCRYIAPGNCNIGGLSLSGAINKAMEAYSPCGPQTP